MKKTVIISFAVMFLVLQWTNGFAAQVKTYVEEFKVVGIGNAQELKGALQTLFASRLSDDNVVPVDAPTGADLLVVGSYISTGKMFSLDVVAKDTAGKVYGRVYDQGESQDELIPAIGRAAQKLKSELRKNHPSMASASGAAPSEVVRPATVPAAGDIVKPEVVTKQPSNGWLSQRLKEAFVGMSVEKMSGGDRIIYIAGRQSLKVYRQGKDLTPIAEKSFGGDEKVLSIDTADLDADGNAEIYLTIMKGDFLASQVFVLEAGALKKVGENLPYFLRGVALEGKTKKIYAQQMGREADFYGDVYELVKSGSSFSLQNGIKLPRFGNVFNFNRFADAAGNKFLVVMNDDGYIIICSAEGEEMWRSSDKFGGSEVFFKRDEIEKMSLTGDRYRWIFLEQRVLVTPTGDLIVPQNTGTVLGKTRLYKKNTVYAFQWNGASLEEKWHTRQSSNYLADYAFDAASKELIMLEVVKKEGIVDKGASVVAIKKTE